jgi:Fe-S cluster biogenesis protein NfuA
LLDLIRVPIEIEEYLEHRRDAHGTPIVIPPDQLYNFAMTSGIQAAPAAAGAPLRDRVQDVINLIRPAVQADGGDIELVDVSSAGVVQIRFHGACHGCPSSHMTLQMGIERNLRERVPEVTQVIPIV